MKTPPVFLISLAAAALVLLVSSGMRNDVWECCDTRAWGWPFPWRVEGGCGAAPSGGFSAIFNASCAIGFAACVSLGFRLLRKRIPGKPPALGMGRAPRS